MFKSCSKCGKIHPHNYTCNVKNAAATNEQTLRNKSAWHRKSLSIRQRSNYICAVCLDEFKRNGTNINLLNYVEVHHITKLKDDPTLLLDDSNLICLCTFHHKQADNGEISAEYLQQLAAARDGSG